MPSNGSGAARNASSCRRSRAPSAVVPVAAALRTAARSCCDGLLAVLLAPTCLACDALLDHPTAGPVCPACWQSIRPLTPPLCDRCGDPVPGLSPLCTRCRHEPSPISIGRSAGAYEGALRSLIHALKYEARRSLARPLAGMVRERCAEALFGADLVVPVPLHWRRRLTRGFNQAEDLARALGLPTCLALRRLRATRPQFGLRPGARRRNVDGAFGPRRAWRDHIVARLGQRATAVAGSCVVLVDDLATTGATLKECAEVLMRMGAREVRSVTVARALTRRSG